MTVEPDERHRRILQSQAPFHRDKFFHDAHSKQNQPPEVPETFAAKTHPTKRLSAGTTARKVLCVLIVANVPMAVHPFAKGSHASLDGEGGNGKFASRAAGT
jgi:hypothetical protein